MTETETDQEKIGFLWIDTGLPRRLHGLDLKSLSHPGAPAALSDVVAWLDKVGEQQQVNRAFIPVHPEQYGRGLLLTGTPGSGKTTTAAAAACAVRRTGKSVYFTRWATHVQRERDLIGRLSQDISSPEETAQALHACDRVESAFLVILDDVGQERPTDSGFGAELLESTLRRRYDEGKPTIVTSNLTSDQWTSRYSAPLRSFIAQACRIVLFTGPDLRSP